MDKYEALMRFVLELDEQTLRVIKMVADKRLDAIAEIVERYPQSPGIVMESVVEDFLNRVDDYLPPTGITPATPDQANQATNSESGSDNPLGR